jgi:hypothetical protein
VKALASVLLAIFACACSPATFQPVTATFDASQAGPQPTESDLAAVRAFMESRFEVVRSARYEIAGVRASTMSFRGETRSGWEVQTYVSAGPVRERHSFFVIAGKIDAHQDDNSARWLAVR